MGCSLQVRSCGATGQDDDRYIMVKFSSFNVFLNFEPLPIDIITSFQKYVLTSRLFIVVCHSHTTLSLSLSNNGHSSLQQQPSLMMANSSLSVDRFASLCYWKENCACTAKDTEGYNFLSCQCGLAREKGLVCFVCEAELVIRFNSKNYTRFWACSNFSRTGCQFTRPLLESSSSLSRASQTTPTCTQGTTDDDAATTAAKRPRLVTPNQRAVADDHGTMRTAPPLRPICLFPTKTLHDTFLGKDLANDVLAALGDSITLQHPGKLHPNEICCYYYNIQQCSNDGNRRPSTVSAKEEPYVAKPPPVVLELFAGAGGMSLGLANAGFEVKFAVESDTAAADTLRSNHKDMVVFHQDVVKFLDEASLQPNSCPFYPIKEVDHIHASPPCQGFSLAKKRRGSCSLTPLLDQQKNELMHQFSRAVRQFRPSTASLENVKGMLATPAKKRYLQQVVAELLKMEYQVRVVLLNAQDYGVPQDRKRLFLFAAKKGLPLPQSPIIRPSFQSVLTVGMALCDLESIGPIQDGIPVRGIGKIEPVFNHNIVKLNCCEEMEYLKRDMLASTVRRRNDIHHYKCDRYITVRERARLQSFPDSYHFCGSPVNQCDQIGNAVPVKLAEAVGRSIMDAYGA
jgi:DNA (cytosine-5)-methyltransferase 1